MQTKAILSETRKIGTIMGTRFF